MTQAPAAVVAVVTDLFFMTKISSTAGALGVPVEVVRTLDELSERLTDRRGALVLIDLEADGVVAAEAIRLCKQAAHRRRIVAFGPHVRTDLITAAREAGADEVLARSAFVARLPALLKERPPEKPPGGFS